MGSPSLSLQLQAALQHLPGWGHSQGPPAGVHVEIVVMTLVTTREVSGGGVGAVMVTVTVDLGAMFKQRQAEETSAAA
jgi:hypothetical protein